ncbi:macrolide family glycosyltransferase [Saccharopolyspora sp. SCSIO 74807]|uniref:macrolide family glycosyltransferase n=1 Tax=Saccharopolyspora sp. SCSIO 74807 TaxID=3118084 RepID=UPI0030CDE7EC
MKHFAFVSMPAHGHVNPTLPIVEELVRRGHRVSYGVGAAFAPVVEAAGATAVPTGSEMPKLPSNFGGTFDPEAMAPFMQHRLADLRENFPVLLEHFQQDPPDAVCFDDGEISGPMLAEKLGVPDVALVPHFAGNERFSFRDLLREHSADAFDHEEHPVFQDFKARLAEIKTEFGVTTESGGFGQTIPSSLNLVFLPAEFQIAVETFDDRFRFIGPSVGGRAESDWRPADSGKPLLFISLGTIFNQRADFFRTCIEAFRDSGWQVAMSIGNVVEPAELGEIPDDFEVRPSFPQPAVLRHASAFLTHSGMNSTMEALYYGVPPIAVPQMQEQQANARRLEELELGRYLDSDEITAAQLRDAVQEVAESSEIRAAVHKMSEAVRNSGGAPAGVDALEAHLGG